MFYRNRQTHLGAGNPATRTMTTAVRDVDVLIVGAGITGLGVANFLREEAACQNRPAPLIAIVERDDEPGGYCRTVERDGFVWDYSGHFFHFARPEMEAWLRAKMPDEEILRVAKRSFIRYAGRDIDFPFQKNIHQLPLDEFADCLRGLYMREPNATPTTFREMALARYGEGIAKRFLLPYNEKLYATDLDTLDAGAMGRFFPHADLRDILANIQAPNNASYNATFTYPVRGAAAYVRGLLRDLPSELVTLQAPVVRIEPAASIAYTPSGAYRYQRLVSSMPLPVLCRLVNEPRGAALACNQVLVWNLGFDKKGPQDVHWMYFPDKARCFYRVGFYDNMHDRHAQAGARMSLYVEIGLPAGAPADAEALRERVLADLRAEAIVTDQQLVASHTVTMQPAYVHIRPGTEALVAGLRADLAAQGIFSAGRYGRWTYCSIEDNLVEAKTLASELLASLPRNDAR